MKDLFPLLYGKLKAATYFATTLSGFKDSESRFKCFDGNESPTSETPFITAEILPGPMHRYAGWSQVDVVFTVVGEDTDSTLLWTIANKIRDTFCDSNSFTDGTPYEVVGPATFSQGVNPVTEHRTVSVGLTFGMTG